MASPQTPPGRHVADVSVLKYFPSARSAPVIQAVSQAKDMVNSRDVPRCAICTFRRLYKKYLYEGEAIPSTGKDIMEGERLSTISALTKLMSMSPEELHLHWANLHRLWLLIRSDSLFIGLRSQVSKLVTLLFYQETSFGCGDKECDDLLISIPVNHEDKIIYKVLDFLPERVTVVSTCNGLVCCRSCTGVQDFVIYVCNPSTKEYTTLRPMGSKTHSAFGLIYDPLDPSHFKVVCARQEGILANVYIFDIFSSRTGTWKTSKEVLRCSYNLHSNQCFPLDNVLHWLTFDHFILTFDTEEEKPGVMRLPGPMAKRSMGLRGPLEHDTIRKCLGESGGHLCYVQLAFDMMEFWVLVRRSPPLWILRSCWRLSAVAASNLHIFPLNALRSRSEQHRSYVVDPMVGHKDEQAHMLEPLALRGGLIFLRYMKKIMMFNRLSTKIVLLCSVPRKESLNCLNPPSVHLYTGNVVTLHACNHHTLFKKRKRRQLCTKMPRKRSRKYLRILQSPQRVLDDDLLLEVLSWLPIKSVSRMRCVSKRWLHLISNPSFVRIQFQRSKVLLGFFYQKLKRNILVSDLKIVNFFPIHHDDMIRDKDLNFLPEEVSIVASCNGLICCRTIFGKTNPFIYICNPYIREWVYIKPLTPYHCKIMGLAFDPSCSPFTFKVVVIRAKATDESELLFEIYASETGSWRVTEGTFHWPYELLYGTNVVYANGILHWPSCKSHHIFAFDVEKECPRIVELPKPMTEDRLTSKCLGESGGFLHYITSSTSVITLWVLKDYSTSEWKLKCRVPLVLRLAMQPPYVVPQHQSQFLDTSDGDNDSDSGDDLFLEVLAFKDEVLLLRSQEAVCTYYPSSGIMERIGFFKYYPLSEYGSVHPYICCPFSLHASRKDE